ncbi:translation elongation factor Ts [Candidatus Babela massiliensis]|uniref:Elongation factor Ts n=1 Tax=Candidatus Babela massiliensis TaxID=673862 RepID=V6DH65_9BACT|nr:translation elongation factor Ts [Candidatus Babela massiliensis]CDK30283.1 Translation elongation factor Ts [Candidatus Babela massiliensis]
MAEISLELIKQLRERTGVGMMDCKKALEETNCDIEKAIEVLRKKGAAIAQKRSGNETSEGLVYAYIHPGSRIGVLLEINCETDFVARTEDMAKFASDIAMQIAAFRPVCVSSENVDPELIEKEKNVYREQLKGKPANIIDQIIEGKLEKYYTEICLLNQPFIKNDKITVSDMLKDLIAKMGESIKIKRFVRYEIGS